MVFRYKGGTAASRLPGAHALHSWRLQSGAGGQRFRHPPTSCPTGTRAERPRTRAGPPPGSYAVPKVRPAEGRLPVQVRPGRLQLAQGRQGRVLLAGGVSDPAVGG